MYKFMVTVPIDQVTEARRTCRILKDGIGKLRDQLAELEAVDPIRDSLAARDRAEAERQRITDDLENAKAEAVKAIQEKAEAYEAEIGRQTAMKGDELNGPDYALIRDGLITDADQLKMMADRNQTNYTLMVAIDRYASSRRWDGFTVVSNAPMVESFGQAWFKLCETAAQNPDGLAMFQIMTEGELRRMLMEYGLLDATQLPENEA